MYKCKKCGNEGDFLECYRVREVTVTVDNMGNLQDENWDGSLLATLCAECGSDDIGEL